MELFIDLETIPSEEPTEDEIKACSRCKKTESIDEDFKNNYDKLLEAALKKKGLGAMDARVVCLGYAFEDKIVRCIVGSEKEIFEKFEKVLLKETAAFSEITLVGFNIKKFDAHLMWLRACLYNLTELKAVLFFGRSKIEDVMQRGVYWKHNEYVSLDKLCKYFGMEGKAGIDGSMVYPMFKDGKIDEIAGYCASDVDKTRKLYKLLCV